MIGVLPLSLNSAELLELNHLAPETGWLLTEDEFGEVLVIMTELKEEQMKTLKLTELLETQNKESIKNFNAALTSKSLNIQLQNKLNNTWKWFTGGVLGALVVGFVIGAVVW